MSQLIKMKTIILIFSIVLLTQCTPEPINNVTVKAQLRTIRTDDNFSSIPYGIIQIDGCEYIMFHPSTSYSSVVHKGNCNNIQHNK